MEITIRGTAEEVRKFIEEIRKSNIFPEDMKIEIIEESNQYCKPRAPMDFIRK